MNKVHASSAFALASGLILMLLIRLAIQRMLQHLLPDWPDWDAHTISVD